MCVCSNVHAQEHTPQCQACKPVSRRVCVIGYAEAQRYSFGHRYELCMEQKEILKIYFFLSTNYSV